MIIYQKSHCGNIFVKAPIWYWSYDIVTISTSGKKKFDFCLYYRPALDRSQYVGNSCARRVWGHSWTCTCQGSCPSLFLSPAPLQEMRQGRVRQVQHQALHLPPHGLWAPGAGVWLLLRHHQRGRVSQAGGGTILYCVHPPLRGLKRTSALMVCAHEGRPLDTPQPNPTQPSVTPWHGFFSLLLFVSGVLFIVIFLIVIVIFLR